MRWPLQGREVDYSWVGNLPHGKLEQRALITRSISRKTLRTSRKPRHKR